MLNSAGFVLLADFLLGRSFVIQGTIIKSVIIKDSSRDLLLFPVTVISKAFSIFIFSTPIINFNGFLVFSLNYHENIKKSNKFILNISLLDNISNL